MSRILVVDDSPTVLNAISVMLSEGGHEVTTSTDGEDALRIAAEEEPHLVLLDVILPKLTGYQVCRKLKAEPKTEKIPVVMITSKAKDKDRQWGLRQGADDYITKPFKSEELLEIVGRILSESDKSDTPEVSKKSTETKPLIKASGKFTEGGKAANGKQADAKVVGNEPSNDKSSKDAAGKKA